ncbi:hypothetical protein ACIGXA_33610 [Streptomyces fildesensis]|uniref:Lipoprotein n=1 Tax=Streptomyces fildesensis TaxID=375757 RepID=A0ABW8CG78_9ACTN
MNRWRGWGFALGAMAMAVSGLTGCAGRYDAGTGLHDATAADVAGSWHGTEGTRVVLRPDGTALVERLDGEGFAFDDGWRLSGTGTWRLIDDPDGQDLHLALTARTRVDRRMPATTPADAVPTSYTWDFFVRRDQHNQVQLFFLFSDPDAANTYVLERAPSALPSIGSAARSAGCWAVLAGNEVDGLPFPRAAGGRRCPWDGAGRTFSTSADRRRAV